MRKSSLLFLIIVLWLNLDCKGWAQENPELLFQAGLYAEEVQGNLARALSYYQKIVQNYPDHRPVAANALLHIGFCYEKLGQDKAYEAYQKILDAYSDQPEVAVLAKERMKNFPDRNQQTKINPLIKYYFDRLGIDILTATSLNGKFLGYTDWTTGNLMIKDLVAGKRTKLTDTDWSRSHEFALRPIWSLDGKFIAYSWYCQPYFTELRVVDVALGTNRIIYSHPQSTIAAQDWHPDGQKILCNVTNFKDDSQIRLALVSLNSGEVQEFLPLDINSRCIKFSPDGNYIAYDTQQSDNRQIYILDLQKSQIEQITSGRYGGKGFDAPIWSQDGKLLLFRSFRLGQYDLWALPMKDGKPNGESFLVQSDLTNAILIMKKISHSAVTKPGQSLISDFLGRTNKISNESFVEDFSSSVLDSSWLVLEWNQPNIYDYASFGRYSLREHAGHLRFYLDPIMGEAYVHFYLPYFSGWYWSYPALQINRIINGNNWELEVRVTYAMIDGIAGRAFHLMILFDPERDRETSLVISRSKDFNTNILEIRLLDRGEVIVGNDQCRAKGDTIGVTSFSYTYRICRLDTLIKVAISEDDGRNFHDVLAGSLRADLLDLPQLLILSGTCWFVPAGSYADWDYIRFRNLN